MAELDKAEIDRLLRRALEVPLDVRECFLDDACGRGTDTRAVVERLLEAGDDDAPPLRPGGGASGPLWRALAREMPASSGTLMPGERLGVFRVVRVLGRGGTSTVYLAARADGQFDQGVALKVLDATRNFAELAARFAQERRILATLDHPGIARLIDGGTTASGAPYVVMEYVDGEPIDAYCDRRRLTVEQRIELFAKVAVAVQYAHGHLIVHRDIKPSNIVVARNGEPKLLDFGIAKLLDPDREFPGAATRSAHPMTPECASPEQVRGQALTTASDVYQLGYLLYGTLTGRSPYSVVRGDVAAIVRAICDTEPLLPSQARADAAVAAARSTTPDRLRRRLAGDLDNILLMALHKDAGKRYASVLHLLEDLRRHLDGLPVTAREATFRYRTAKFASRHRVGMATAASTVALLAAGTVALVLAYGEARRSEQAARTAQAETAAINTFLRDILASPRPSASGAQTLMTEVLDQAAARLPERFGDQPALASQVRSVLARSYDSLARYEQAALLREAVLRQSDAAWQAGDPAAIDAAIDLATSYAELSRFDEAENLLADIRRRVTAARLDDVRLATRTDTADALLAYRRGDVETAAELYDRAWARAWGALTADDDAYRTVWLGWLTARLTLGDTQAAEPEVRALLADALERFGERHAETLRARNLLVFNLAEIGSFAEAERHARTNLATAEAWLGETDLFTVTALNSLANVLGEVGKHDEALGIHERALASGRRTLGDEHPYTLTLLGNVATRLDDAERYVEAERAYEEAVEIAGATLGPDHRQTLLHRGNLARLRAKVGRRDEAEAELRAVVAGFERGTGPRSGDTLFFAAELGDLLRERGDHAAAVEVLAQALALAEEAHGAESPLTVRLRDGLAAAEAGIDRTRRTDGP